jgi:quercetin dioxygenase-like cupin family protein
MITRNETVQAVMCNPGVNRKVLSYSADVMLCELFFEKGAQGNLHSHTHQQISYVASGVFEYIINGKKELIRTGDSVYIPANAEHGTVCIEAGKLIDVFCPMRGDFLS